MYCPVQLVTVLQELQAMNHAFPFFMKRRKQTRTVILKNSNGYKQNKPKNKGKC